MKVDVVYKEGKFFPLEKIELPEGWRGKIIIDPLIYFKELLKKTKKYKITNEKMRKLEEVYYEGKMLS